MIAISTYTGERGLALQKIVEKYQVFAGKASNCILLDEGISKIRDEIISENKKVLENKGSKAYLEMLEVYKNTLESKFIDSDCRNKIENKRQIESAKLITTQAIKQEENVLKKNEKEQYIYIGLGSLVLLVGLYLIIKKK